MQKSGAAMTALVAPLPSPLLRVGNKILTADRLIICQVLKLSFGAHK